VDNVTAFFSQSPLSLLLEKSDFRARTYEGFVANTFLASKKFEFFYVLMAVKA
jgi:hypothetical protein